MSLNSFNTRSTLKVGNKEYEIYRLDALDQARHLYQTSPLLAPHPAGESPPHRRRPQRKKGRHPLDGRLGQEHEEFQARQRNRLHPQPRPPPGFHRSPLRSRSSRDARRHAATRRRSRAHQSSSAGRTGNRPLRPGRRIRHRQRLRRERPARIPAQQRALLLPPLGPNRIPQPRHSPSRHRHSPPGKSRISSPSGLRPRKQTASQRQPTPTPS